VDHAAVLTMLRSISARESGDGFLSAAMVILDSMTELAVVPAWVVADHQQVADFNYMVFTLATELNSVHGKGQLAAVGWVTGVRPAPMTQRDEPVTWALARAESWVALTVAACNADPVTSDWAMLGVEQRPWVAGDQDFAHGAWRTLAWLLGVRADPPIAVPVREVDGTLAPGEERYATHPDPSSPIWQEADRRRRQRNSVEALRWYRHVRDRIEAAHGVEASVD
jgi:hypothetical protein